MFRKITVFIFLFAVFLCEKVSFTDGKTAPEFTVAVSSKDFIQIHIPLETWNNMMKNAEANKSQLKQNGNLVDFVEEDVPDTLSENKPVNEITLDIYSPDDVKPDPIINAEPLSDVVEPAGEVIAEAAADPVPIVEEVLQPVAEAPILEETIPEPVMVVVNSTRAPCKCAKGKCSCCVTVMRSPGCANVKFLPEEFAFEMDMTFNGDVITRRKLPISDPPPICINPRRAPFLELCARINNIHLKQSNVHMCVDIDASIAGFDLLSWNYNCLKFGNGGLLTGLNPNKNKVKRKPLQPVPGLGSLGGGGGGGGSDEDDDDDGGFFGLFGGGGGGDDDDGDVLGDLLDDDY